MPSQTPLPDAPAVEAIREYERDAVVQQLADDFAADRLSLEDYEQRVQRALRVVSRYDLAMIRSDLPTMPSEGPVVNAARHDVRGLNLLAIMGGVTRRGRWVVPPRMQVWAVMGGVTLDLRDAQFTAAVTEIRILAVMGGVQIRVPPGVRLETDGVAIMGGFDDNPGVFRSDSPVVRVTGFAFMGGVGTDSKPRGTADDD